MAYNTFAPTVYKDMTLCLDSFNLKSYDNISSDWYDLSGRSNNALLYNSPLFDVVLSFDGVNDYGIIPYNSDFDLTGDFTLESYFSPNAFVGIIISSDAYGSSFDWCIYLANDSQISIYSNGTGTNVTADIPQMIVGDWYHCIITSNAGLISIYVDGILYISEMMSISNSNTDITVGCAGFNNPNSFFSGRISTVKVYKTSFTSEQVQQNYSVLKNRFK